MKKDLKDYLVRSLNELLITKKQYQRIDAGNEFAKLEWFIFDVSKHEKITNSNVRFVNCIRDVLVKSNLDFGYSVINHIMTVKANNNLGIDDIKKYNVALHKMNLSNDNYTGKLYYFDPLKPDKIRLAELDDLIKVVDNLLDLDDEFINQN